MMGTSLSRWTMACFAAALFSLVAAQILMVAGFGHPAVAIEAPETLILVHLVTIGWLSLLMLGALFQFVPVLVVQPLRNPGLVLPALFCLLSGLALLLAGFLQMTGLLYTGFPLLASGGVLIVSGFLLALWPLAHTLWRARPLPLPARFVAIGLACLVATITFGLVFTLVLSGAASSPFLAAMHAHLVPFHASAGFGGWLTFTAIGVSYRLLPMFMLAPEKERATARAVGWFGSAAILLIVVASPVAALAGTEVWPVTTVAGVLAGIALGCYGADLIGFYRGRRRRNVELNIKASAGALAILFLSAVLLAVLSVTGSLAQHAGALVYLAAFGWLTGLGLSQLYKIVPFLTWLECYGPIMGRRPTPRVQDLVVERRDGAWFVLYFLGVLTGTASLLLDMPGLFRIASAATLAATMAIIVELVLARRLRNVAPAARLPEGAQRPRLFLPLPNRS